MRQISLQAAIAFGAFAALCAYVLAGDINPPAGPVNSTFKTMQEVEPRIAVNSVNTPGDASNLYIISQPGSYYLTGNILGEANKHGIAITIDDVTLDLNGFHLRGKATSLNGLNMSDFKERIVVRNGSITDWGGNGAVLAIDSGSVENVRFGENRSWGLSMGNTFGGRVSECVFMRNGMNVNDFGGGLVVGSGFLVQDCVAYDNSGYGIQFSSNGVVSRCTVWSTNADSGIGQNGSGIISGSTGCTVESSTASGNAGSGISLPGVRGLVRGCNAHSNGLGNIVVGASGLVIDSQAP